jgi:hypothetical protein
LVLQEPNGTFGVNVKKGLFQPENLLVECSSSGKVTTSILNIYYEEILKKNFTKLALIHDTFAVKFQRDKFSECFQKDSMRLQIPQKCTSTHQPLDVFVFRQWKNFAKRCYNRVALDELNYDLRSRNGVIKLQSLIYNQLASNVFAPMWKYAWIKAGYFSENYETFQTVDQICFDNINFTCSLCEESSFLRCAFVHCKRVLCFHHFYESYHYH